MQGMSPLHTHDNSDTIHVQALVVANIADEILRKYGDAYNIDYDPTNISNMAMSNTASMSEHGGKNISISLERMVLN